MRLYENTIEVNTHSDTPTVLTVNLDRLSKCLRTDTWAQTISHRNEWTFNNSKYKIVRKMIEEGAQIEMPWIFASESGHISVMDGRHRLYALIDLGYTHARVVADPDEAFTISAHAR